MIHHVYANRSNVGDWLSASGIRKLLGRSDVVEHLCDAPFVPATLEALRAAAADDLIVVGGGGLFAGYFSPFWQGLLPIARRVPVCIWGVGVCDPVRGRPPVDPGLLGGIVGASALCRVRDELTRSFVGEARTPGPVHCPVLNALEPDGPPPPDGAVLHVDHFDNVGARNFERMEAFAAAHAARTGRPHHRTNNIITAGDVDALQRTIDLYRSAAVVLTSRLHGCLIAAALRRPFLAVSADRKVDAFMRAAGLERSLCQLDEIGTIPERLAELERDPPDASAFVRATRLANEEIAGRVCALAKG